MGHLEKRKAAKVKAALPRVAHVARVAVSKSAKPKPEGQRAGVVILAAIRAAVIPLAPSLGKAGWAQR